MGVLDGFKPADISVSNRTGKWRPSEIVAEFLSAGEVCMAKDFADESEFKGTIHSLRQYLQRPPGNKLGVSVHQRGRTIMLCNHNLMGESDGILD